MRLRQVALIARSLEPVTEALEAVFGLQVAFRDPAVGVFGLANAILPVGGEFIEVLEPIREDTAGGRYLERRGGDAGYMIILQADDAVAHRERITGLGVKPVARNRDGRYRFTHFHPAHTAGILLSIDSVEGDEAWREPRSDWPPAGRVWREYRGDQCVGIAAVIVQAQDPAAAAARWAELLDAPLDGNEGLRLRLERGEIRFVAPVDAYGAGVVGLDILVRDVDEVFANARRHGCTVHEGVVVICGAALRPIAA